VVEKVIDNNGVVLGKNMFEADAFILCASNDWTIKSKQFISEDSAVWIVITPRNIKWLEKLRSLRPHFDGKGNVK
jgi:hypothetical protein